MNITVLGSSGKQTGLRECVSILAEIGENKILFDAGPGIVTSLYRANRKLTDIDTIVLTHVHGDHILGFAYLIYNRVVEYNGMSAEKKMPLKVIGNDDTLVFARNMLETAYKGMKIPFELTFVKASLGNELVISDSCRLHFYNAIHAVPTISTIITDSKHKVVYTSDTLPNEELIDSFNGADMLIHEAMYLNTNLVKSRKSKHATAFDAGTMASKINAGQLVMVHIAQGLLGKEVDMLNEAAQAYNGVISIPYDGTVYHI